MTVQKFVRQTETRLCQDLKFKYEIFPIQDMVLIRFKIPCNESATNWYHSAISIPNINYNDYEIWYNNLLKKLKEAILSLYFY